MGEHCFLPTIEPPRGEAHGDAKRIGRGRISMHFAPLARGVAAGLPPGWGEKWVAVGAGHRRPRFPASIIHRSGMRTWWTAGRDRLQEGDGNWYAECDGGWMSSISMQDLQEERPAQKQDQQPGREDETIPTPLSIRDDFYYHMARAAEKHLTAGSSVINTAFVTDYRGRAHLLDHAATQAAIVGFTRSLARQWADRGIRVNAVAPGPIWTTLLPAIFDPEGARKCGADTLMGRAGQPWEAATAYVFLASDDGFYFTGQTLHPNGGDLLHT